MYPEPPETTVVIGVGQIPSNIAAALELIRILRPSQKDFCARRLSNDEHVALSRALDLVLSYCEGLDGPSKPESPEVKPE